MAISRRDFSRLEAKGYHYDKDAADRAVYFFAHYLRHTAGEWEGRPFELFPWEENDVIRPAFGWMRPDGTRLFRTVYIEIPKKNGKSPLAAGSALLLLHADNEPGAEVYSAACDKNQATIVFKLAAQMNKKSPPLRKRSKMYQRAITVEKTGGVYRVISADAFRQDGYNVHGNVIDELHRHKNRALVDVLLSGTAARRQPMSFLITTAGDDPESICAEFHKRTLQVNAGLIEDDSFLGVIYAADKEDDWKSEETWKKANPSYPVTPKPQYMRDQIARAEASPAFLNTLLRLNLNIWCHTDERWLPLSVWDKSAGQVDVAALRGRKCWTGLDLSANSDLTSFVHVFPFPDGSFKWLPRFFMPKQRAIEFEGRYGIPYTTWERAGLLTLNDGDTVDYSYVREQLLNDRKVFNIREIGFDPYGAIQLVLQLQGDGFELVEMRQGWKTMAPIWNDMVRLTRRGLIHHGAHPILRWMSDNLVLVESGPGNLAAKKPQKHLKIDGMVAGAMGTGRAIANGGGKRSVYATRGLISI